MALPNILLFILAMVPSPQLPHCIANPDAAQPADYNGLQCFPSPDGKKVVTVSSGIVRVLAGGKSTAAGKIDLGRILWRPDSAGFVIADQEGSGESQSVSYVDAMAKPPRASTRLRQTATERFRATFRCEGENWFANTIVDGWEPNGRLRLVVQEMAHSDGCNPAGSMIGVVGDPLTGRIDQVLSARQVRERWCSPSQRRAFGYCYDDALRGR